MKAAVIKKLLKLFSFSIIVLASVIVCRQIISNSIFNQKNKDDYAELNHVKYGLFNVEEWKRQITVILAEEIDKLYLSKTDERELRKHIEVLLNALIDEVDRKIRGENHGLKQSFMNIFFSAEDLKKGIPEYTDAVMHELTKSKTRGQIKALLKKRLQHYLDQTVDTGDASQLSSILLRTGSTDIESARTRLSKEISAAQHMIRNEAILLIVLQVVLFTLSGLSRRPLAPARFVLLILSLIMLLIAGVTTPMIDLEAKISHMSFVLMGHPVHFEDQVLYFRSKSILDVFRVLITHKDIQMKFVGVLLITFSVFFPLFKIASSLGYYYNYHGARENPLIRFFVLKSGKWSMADVMVVAIFMAYIGMSGVIASQLDQLSSAGRDMDILTTNGTSLQPGYYLFLAYTLLALFLTEFLTRKLPDRENAQGE
jgi:hypothetical protein